MTIAMASTPKVVYAFALMSGCLFWYSFIMHKTDITYMKLESAKGKVTDNSVDKLKWETTELEICLAGTHMVAATKHPFHYQCHPHSIE